MIVSGLILYNVGVMKSEKQKLINILILAGFLFLIAGIWQIMPSVKAEEQENSSTKSALEQRLEYERQLQEIEREMAELQKTIDENRQQQRTLANEIAYIDAQINRFNLQIRAIDIDIANLNREIVETQQEINRTGVQISEKKEAISSALRSLHKTQNTSMVSVFLAHNTISEFFGSLTNIILVQNTLQSALADIVILRENLLAQKEELSLSKRDTENLRNAQEIQRNNLQGLQGQRRNLLTATRGREAEYQNLLEETKKTAAEIRSRIFQMIGGGELSFENAFQIARLVQDATGVRAALLLAVLDRESGLGINVGRCTYNQIIPQTGLPVMHPTRDIPVFEAIAANLKNAGIAPGDPIPVSCPILRDGNHGGAMGPSQFIPSTWAIFGGYERNSSGNWVYNPSKDRISQVTGNRPSSPWNNTDAFTATGLYLKQLMSTRACNNYGNEIPSIRQTLIERCAAAMYYAGGRWYTYRFWYGDAVVKRADRLEEDIRIMMDNN